MASVRTPWVLPIQSGTDLFGTITRTPAIVRITLGIKPGTPASEIKRLTEVSTDYIERLRPQLLSFYRGANMNAQLGVIPIALRQIQFAAGMARYTTQPGGQEIIDITIYPDLAAEELKKLEFQYDYLEVRFEWSNDNGGDDWFPDYQDSLPKLNTDRSLVVHAKVKGPKKIRDEALFIRSQGMDRNDPVTPVYYPQKVSPIYSYTVDAYGTWVGDQYARGWGKTPDFAGKKHVNGDGSTFDGKFYLLAAEPYSGGTPDKKHATSFLVDLQAFKPSDEIDIEFRAYWGNSYDYDPLPSPDGSDSPFQDVKVTYRLLTGGKMYWPPNETKLIKPLTKWVDFSQRRSQDQLYIPFLSNGQREGPYRYTRLIGGSAANGCGGDWWYYDYYRLPAWGLAQYGSTDAYYAGANGGPRVGEEHFAFDESAHREAEVFTQGYTPTGWTPGDPVDYGLPNQFVPQSLNGDARASWPQVNTPGWYVNMFELSGAYTWPNDQYETKPALRSDDPQHGFEKFGMYAYCFDDQGFLTLDQIIAGNPPTFIGKNVSNPSDPRNTDGSFKSDWPTGFSACVYTPEYNAYASLGYTGTWRVYPCTPRQKIEWNTFKADCFLHVGGSETAGVLVQGQQVTDIQNSDYNKIGTYFGNVKYTRGAVAFSQKGPDPTLD